MVIKNKPIRRMKQPPAQKETIIVVEREKKSGCGCVTVIIGLLIMAILVPIAIVVVREESKNAGKASSSSASASEKAKVEDDGSPGEYALDIVVRRYFREHLNDPDSAKVLEKRFAKLTDGWMYVVDYNAKNSFGGYVRAVLSLHFNSSTRQWTYYEDPDQALKIIQEKRVITDKNGSNVSDSYRGQKSSR